MKTQLLALFAALISLTLSACNTCDRHDRNSHRGPRGHRPMPMQSCSVHVDIGAHAPVEMIKAVANEAARLGGSDQQIEAFVRSRLGPDCMVRVTRNGGGQMGSGGQNFGPRPYGGARFNNAPPYSGPDSVYGGYRAGVSVSGNPSLRAETMGQYYEGMMRSGTPVYVQPPPTRPTPWGSQPRPYPY